MVGATSRRFALVLAATLVALSFVSDGGPSLAAHRDRSTEIAGVPVAPPALAPAFRRPTSVGSATLRAHRTEASRGPALLALVSLLWPLPLGGAIVSRRRRRPWAGPAHHRFSVSLRAPPLVS